MFLMFFEQFSFNLSNEFSGKNLWKSSWNPLDQIFGQVFDHIFGQGFDQGFGEGKSHKYSVQYYPA